MPTYVFAEKNGSGALTLSEDSEEEATAYLKEITKFPQNWRLDDVEAD